MNCGLSIFHSFLSHNGQWKFDLKVFPKVDLNHSLCSDEKLFSLNNQKNCSFLITFVPVINLSTWALIKFEGKATSLSEEEYFRHALQYIKLTLSYSSHSNPRLLKSQFSNVFLFGITR